MKVLHLLQSNRFSGAENVVCQIIGMFKDEADIEMVYCSSDGQIREALEERNIKFVPLEEFSVKAVKKAIKEQKPDVIHAHDMRASFYAACACGRIPLVSHIHNNNFDSRGISLKSLLYSFAARKSKHIFWVSRSAFEGYAFHKSFEKKSSILYNIVNIDTLYEKMLLDSNTYDYDVAYVGRLVYQKNPQRLMQVCRLLKEKKCDVKIAVVGTGDQEDEVKALADEYGLQDNVRFLGFLSNPLKVLHDSKVMIMTSLWEGTPMCVLEAMALGVPVVSTPVDGLKEIIVNDNTGYLCEGDSEFADRIIELVSDDEKQARFSYNVREFSKKYNDIKTYKSNVLRAYRKNT